MKKACVSIILALSFGLSGAPQAAESKTGEPDQVQANLSGLLKQTVRGA